MPFSSLNIGLGNIGCELVKTINTHFIDHEKSLYNDYVLSAYMRGDQMSVHMSMDSKDGTQTLQHNSTDVKSWFDKELYGTLRSLSGIASNTSGEIRLNIVLSLSDETSSAHLRLLLAAVTDLRQQNQIDGVTVSLFVLLYDPRKDRPISVQPYLSIIEEFNSEINDIYYIDDRNSDKIILNLDTNWLAFALAEFFIFQMIGPTSGAVMEKSKVFGMGVLHFNELLFRKIVLNKILQYKFEEEGIIEEAKVHLKNLFNKCNPFISAKRNYFSKFLELYPFSVGNYQNITENTAAYNQNFHKELLAFITNEDNTLGESKALLAHFLGEDDGIIEGINWSEERFDIQDLEFDIIDFFNQYLQEEEKVYYPEQKKLRNQITQLEQGIKGYKSNLRNIEAQIDEIEMEVQISVRDGIFSVDGKRVHASGYIPSPVNPADEFYNYEERAIPEQIDLSAYFPPAKDQGVLGSCTAFTVSAVYEFFARRNNKNVAVSELFIYYNAREIYGQTDEDSGATLIHTIQSAKTAGACLSEAHPYDVSRFALPPSSEAYAGGREQTVKHAMRVNIDEKDFKYAIANGYPVIVGIKIFKSFYPKDKTGVVPFPSNEETAEYANHAVLLVGYSDGEKLFKVRNSWGTEFGDHGYCYVPYDYVVDRAYCMEAFVITEIADLKFDTAQLQAPANFSFLKNAALRRKLIINYTLREAERELRRTTEEYEEVAFKNELNAEKIKDPLFRKSLRDKMLAKSNEAVIQATTGPVARPTNTTSILLIIVGLFLIIAAGYSYIAEMSVIVVLLLAVGAISCVVSGLFPFFKKKEVPAVAEVPAKPVFGDQEKYAFEVADDLFANFDKLKRQLIRRYKSISSYYSWLRNWQKESHNLLQATEFSSPDFVINVIKKKPLLDYLNDTKSIFLSSLPYVSTVFHKGFIEEENNVDEVCNDLFEEYVYKINNNIDSVLDISIVNYLQGTQEYPYLDPPPPLQELLNTIDRISKPFCNGTNTLESARIQNYVIHEKIKSQENDKLSQFQKNRSADIQPILVFRESNRCKYVAIQLCGIKNNADVAKLSLVE